MARQFKNVQLKHTVKGEEGWMKSITENRYIPDFLRFPLVLCCHYMFWLSYLWYGVYQNAEEKVETLIKVYNETNPDSDHVTRVAIVTGANTGIGFETARMLVRAGFYVIIACRNKTKALEAIKRIEENSESVVEGRKGKAHFLELDLTSFQSVRNFVQNFLKLDLPLHYLINNAGIMWLPKFELTEDNHEMQFQVNHLSHFLLIDLLLPKLKETKGISKVINLSSNGHYGAGLDLHDFTCMDDRTKYDPYKQYFKSKAANVITTYKLHRLLKDSDHYGGENGIVTYACHPGFVSTELTRYTVNSTTIVESYKNATLKSPLQGALPTLRLVFLSPDQLQSDADLANCTQASKFTKGAPNHHLYYSDELPITPLISTLDEKNQDNLWELSKTIVA